MEIKRGEISFTFQRRGSFLNVTATDDSGRVAYGALANDGRKIAPTVWPRLEFWFGSSDRWIAPFCDHRYWHLDDYETSEETERRPVDSGTFDLAPEETSMLQAWCNSQYVAVQHAESAAVAASAPTMDIDSGLGIGRLSADTDHASELIAQFEAAEITRRQAAQDPHARKPVLCSCGHYDAFPMSTGRGTACADCYDRMSD